MGHIVVGVDETPQAAAALRWAADEAAVRGWRITAVLAWDLLSQHHRDPTAPFDPGYDGARAREALDAYIESTLGPAPGADVERRVVCDLPAHALLDAARGADLLVVGSRDLHGIRRALAGSVSVRCRRHPPCPVIIVHSDGRTEAVDLNQRRQASAASADAGTADRAMAGHDPHVAAVEWQMVPEDRRSPAHPSGRGRAAERSRAP